MAAPGLHEDPERTTSIGLARYAVDFFEAALAADDKLGNKTGYEIVAPIPVMFLVGQADLPPSSVPIAGRKSGLKD